jgi:hypothetical protein
MDSEHYGSLAFTFFDLEVGNLGKCTLNMAGLQPQTFDPTVTLQSKVMTAENPGWI